MTSRNGLALLKHVDILLALAACKGVTHAAQNLGMTQSAVTKALHRAEADLGQPLFVRHSKGVTPTAAGKISLEYARLIKGHSVETLNRIDGLQNFPSILNVGAGASFLDSILPAAIAEVVNTYPSISIRLKNESVSNLVTQIRNGEQDLVFISEPADIDAMRDLRWTPLIDDEMDIVAREDHPLAHRKSVEMDDLKSFGWALGNDLDPQRRYLEGAFRSKRMALPKVTVEALSRTVAVQIVRNSDLLTLVPSFGKNPTYQDLVRIDCPELRWVRIAGTVTREGVTLPNGGKLLIKYVRKLCQTHDSGPINDRQIVRKSEQKN